MFANVGKKAREPARIQVQSHQQVAAAAEVSADKQKRVTGAALDEMKNKYRNTSQRLNG